MRSTLFAILAVAVLGLLVGCNSNPTKAAPQTESYSIASSTKFRNIEYLYTTQVHDSAKADGANYDYAIREVGWELISGIGKAADSIPGVEAVVFSRINFKDKRSFHVIGIVVGGRSIGMTGPTQSDNPTVSAFLNALAQNSIKVEALPGGRGVEMSASQ